LETYEVNLTSFFFEENLLYSDDELQY